MAHLPRAQAEGAPHVAVLLCVDMRQALGFRIRRQHSVRPSAGPPPDYWITMTPLYMFIPQA